MKQEHTTRISLALAAAFLLSGCAATSPATPSVSAPARSASPFEARDVPVLHSHVYRTVLPNGLTVVVIPRPVVPVVSFRIGILAGSARDPAGKGGVADLTASLLNRGTSTRDALTLFRQIDETGGSLEATAGQDMTTVSGKVLTSDLSSLFGVAADMVLNPVFPEKEFRHNLLQAKAGLMDEKDHAGPVARNLFYKTLYGNGPYGHPASGTLRSVSRITLRDIRTFYRTEYRPDRTIVTFAGDITPEKALKLVRSVFGSWKSDVSTALPPSTGNDDQTPLPTRQTILVNRPQFAQAMVMMGTPGIRRNDPAFYSALVMNEILGGTTTSRLNHVVRQKNGLVYYIYSGFDAQRHSGPFFVVFQTFPPNTPKVISLSQKLLRDMKERPVSDQEVETTRNNILGQFPFRVDTDDRIASLLLYIEAYDLGLGYFTDYPDSVRKVTPQSVQEAAKNLLHPEHLVTVVVGPIPKTGMRPNGKDVVVQ